MNIYVGNLPYTASEDEIRQAFEVYGGVESVTLIKDKETGRMRGFGFVEMPDETEAQAAIQAMNGKEFMRRSLVVNPARPREERSGGGGRSGGFSGGGGRRPSGGGYQDRQGDDRNRRNDW